MVKAPPKTTYPPGDISASRRIQAGTVLRGRASVLRRTLLRPRRGGIAASMLWSLIEARFKSDQADAGRQSWMKFRSIFALSFAPRDVLKNLTMRHSSESLNLCARCCLALAGIVVSGRISRRGMRNS
jgi:hypothetical protein